MNSLYTKVKEDLRQAPEYAKYMKVLGWETIQILNSKIEDPNKHQIIKSKIQIFIKKIGAVKVAKILRVRAPLVWKEIDKLIKEQRILTTRIEPRECDVSDFKENGFVIDKEPLRATKTILIDLSKEENEILAGFDRARSWIKKIPPQKIVKDDFALFYDIWKKATKIQHIWSSGTTDYWGLVKSFGKKAFCLTIDDTCGVLILTHEKTAYYYYAAALPEAKKANLPYLLVWEAIKEAKKRGCKVWDWEGIFDERWPNKGWKGFSQFKKTFGGEVVDFPGSFSRWNWKALLPV